MDTFIDMNEEDGMSLEATQLEEQQSQTSAQAQAPRKRRKTSWVWEEFVSVGVESDGKERARCVHCGMKLVTRNEKYVSCGTHHLQRHLETCPKKPPKEDKAAYDHNIDRVMVSEAIIYHDLPFRYAEFEKVRARDKYLNPDCKIICRQTAAADVYKRYEAEKEKLKKVFAGHTARVCFTTDLWTSRPNSMGYICLTAHFIDDGWNLQSKILAFCDLKPPHTGEEIANKILECMIEWGLEKKVFSLTVDNANNNDCMQRILKGQLQMMSGYGLLCDGKYLHVRCCAHILNLIVKEGLELAKNLLHNIRESVRYVKASGTRIQAFAACVERVGIPSGSGLSLDVSTRWNSTYEMLVRALKFRRAFKSLEAFDRHYIWLPSEREWDRGQKISELLKPFSQITNHFSGSKYPTSNVYFLEVWRIEKLL